MKLQRHDLIRLTYIIIFCGQFLLYITIDIVASPNIPQNFDGWVMDALAKLEVSGISGGFHRNSLPLSRAEVAKIIQRTEDRIRGEGVNLSPIDRKLLEKLKREFQFELDQNTVKDQLQSSKQKTYLRIQPELRLAEDSIAPAFQSGFHYSIGNNRNLLTLYSELEISNFEQGQRFVESYFLPDTPPLLKSADQRYEPWHWDYVIDFKRSYLQFQFMPFAGTELDLLVGRDFVFWGASPYGSVGISDNSPPFDLIRLTGTFPCPFGSLKVSAFSSQLNGTWFDDGTTRYLAKRYLSAHRLDYQFSDWLEIGVSEWVLYGGDAQSVEWHYLNPVIPYYAVQYNAKSDDNLMIGFDGAVRPFDGLRLYAEWVADDYQYQSDSNDPHAVTWLAGIEWYPMYAERKLGLHSEYVRVNRWAYTHLEPDNQFTHFGAMIGHPIGTDADIITIRISYQATPSSMLDSRFSHQRNGEAGITDRFYGEDFENIPFPSGNVERLSEIHLGWKYRPIVGFNGSIHYALRFIQNVDNVEGISEQQHRLAFLLAWTWST